GTRGRRAHRPRRDLRGDQDRARRPAGAPRAGAGRRPPLAPVRALPLVRYGRRATSRRGRRAPQALVAPRARPMSENDPLLALVAGGAPVEYGQPLFVISLR